MIPQKVEDDYPSTFRNNQWKLKIWTDFEERISVQIWDYLFKLEF
jgi:GTPase SAR1 family protein